MMKILDALFVIGLGYLLYERYLTDPIFDLVAIGAFVYVAIRQWKDINILSLCLIGIVFKLIVTALGTGAGCMNGFAYWPLTLLVCILCAREIVNRPVTFSNLGRLKKRTDWAITNADDAILLVMALMIIFNSFVLVEHIIRHTIYPVQFLYDNYEKVQAAFTVISTAILLFVVNTEPGKGLSKFRDQPDL